MGKSDAEDARTLYGQPLPPMETHKVAGSEGTLLSGVPGAIFGEPGTVCPVFPKPGLFSAHDKICEPGVFAVECDAALFAFA